MTTQLNVIPHRIVITVFALVFSFADFIVTPIIAQGALQKCGLFFLNHACTIKDDVLPLLAFMFHVAAWVAFFVMAYGWIVGTRVRRFWPLAGTASSLVSIFLISQHTLGNVGQVVLMAGSSICLAIYLCYFHLFSNPNKRVAANSSLPYVVGKSNAAPDRLSVFLAATALSFMTIIGTPLFVMMAALDATSKGGIEALRSIVTALMVLSMFFSYGVMGIRWIKHEDVNRIWPIICAVSIFTLIFEIAGENFARHGAASILEVIGGLCLIGGSGIGMATYLCYFYLRGRRNVPSSGESQ